MARPNSNLNLHERRRRQDDDRTSNISRGPAPLRTDIGGYSTRNQAPLASPETPLNSGRLQQPSDGRVLFHNYLRAFCHFEPPKNTGDVEKALLMTVRIQPGDLILVHSVHANGWADGTVLSSGARGWLPTNYGESFDHPYMRNLLNAMTQFWDLLGASEDANLSTFVRQDYVRPLIAGVRYLLEHADCLHREAALIQRNSGLRRLRKGLLADLSTLVQIAKRLQEIITEPYAGEVVHVLLDDIMTKAFKVVTRAVGFVDMLEQERDTVQTLDASKRSRQDPATLTGTDANNTKPLPEIPEPIDSAKHFPTHSIASYDSDGTTKAGHSAVATTNDEPPRTPRITPSGSLVTHRLSMVRREHTQSKTMASEQLAQAHDTCISCIGAFIGLYLHPSSPASDLIATTGSLVSACETMLVIVNKVSAHEPQQSASLQLARTQFQVRLGQLTTSTKIVSRQAEHVDDDIVLSPEQTGHLVDLGTSLIRTVGDCVVKTRKIIEQLGDFDLGDGSSQEKDGGEEQTLPGAPSSAERPRQRSDPQLTVLSEKSSPIDAQPNQRPSRPRAVTTSDGAEVKHTTTATAAALATPKSTAPPPLHSSLPLPSRSVDGGMRATVTSVDARISVTPLRAELENEARQCSMGPSIASSTETRQSNMRDSGITAVSEVSTRATTPEQGKDTSERDAGLTDSYGSFSSLRSTTHTDSSFDAEANLLQKTYANELTLNKDGQVTGGSLPALVEQLATADITPDPQFVAAFFVTFRSFTTPRELAQTLIYRFDYVGDSSTIGTPVRLRVCNVFKHWMESYWNVAADREALGDIRYFALHKLKPHLPPAGERLVELTRKVSALYHNGAVSPPSTSGFGKLSTPMGVSQESESTVPEPIIGKTQLNALRNALEGKMNACTIVDFDPLELARQMTILASSIFCEIQSGELLSLEWSKKDSSRAQNVRNMCILNTDVAHIVGDTILTPDDAKKRALVIKHWSKVAMRCLELNNYESLMAIMCSLNSSVVQRLKRTWEMVSKKTRARLDELNTVVDFSRNHASLRRRLEDHVVPCVPFLGIYLTDLTMVDAGNPKLRELPGSVSESGETLSVINFDKHMRMAKIVGHLQKFQVLYRLKEIPELQAWMQMHLERMREGNAQMVGVFHRRSLFIEPKRNPGNVAVPKMPELRRPSEPTLGDDVVLEQRPKTAGSIHPTVRSLKPHGPTFEFLLKTNFNFKTRPELVRTPDAPEQK